MFTVILAFVNSKYETKYDCAFFGTFIIDVILIEGIIKIVLKVL